MTPALKETNNQQRIKMYLTKYKTNGLTDLFAGSVDSILDNFWGSYHSEMTVDEVDDNYKFSIELPGFNKKEINISVKNGSLGVTAERGEKKRSRTVTLPSDANEDKISASLKNGVLSITIPKIEEKNTKIPIS
jgi:HSP20 family protein